MAITVIDPAAVQTAVRAPRAMHDGRCEAHTTATRDPLHEIIVGTLSDLAKMVVGFGVFALWAILLIGVFG